MNEHNQHASLKRLDRQVTWQRLFMSFEQLWAGWARPLMVLGVISLVLVSGVLSGLPLWLRYGILVLLAAALLWACMPLFNQPRIKRLQVLRKLEQAAGTEHRAVSSAGDVLATEFMDPRAESLWTEHKYRQLTKVQAVKLVPPQSRWRQFDPYALRVPVALGLVASLILGQGTLKQNLGDAFRIAPAIPAVALSIDAWLKPPAYTGRPPLLLTSAVVAEKLKAGLDIETPDKAVFSLRVAGAQNPQVQFYALGTDTVLDTVKPVSVVKDDVLTMEASLERPLVIVVRDGPTELARWPISLLPDAAPTMTVVEQPTSDAKGNLALKWHAQDDYGLRKILGELELADEQDGQTGFDSNGIFLFDAPELKFVLRKANGRDEKGSTKFDLAKHPWAGFQVTLSMTALDGAGQDGKATPVTFKMPERVFVKPLPRALIEQRKQLVLYPERAAHIGTLIDTLNLYPKGLFDGVVPSIIMGSISSRLRNAAGYDDIHYAMDQMWDLAVKLEDGSLADLRAELKSLKEQLEKALREGAPQERIAELMDKMRGAMDKYLDAMRRESERRSAEGEQPPSGGDGKSVSREDLQKMLDEMQDMSKGGDNDTAQQMLDKLDELLQNLQPGGERQAGGNGNMDDMMQGLGDMMKKQKRLMDDTQRMPGAGEQPGDDGTQGQGPKGKGGKGLAEQQQDLRDKLDGLKGQGGNNGDLEDSSRAMGEAEDSLRKGDKEGALQKQGEALDKLRKGAQKMADQMREQGQGQAEGDAKDGEGRSGNDDPLGRPRATRTPDTGPTQDIVPNEEAMQRAREILETLRAKANDRGLTDQEKAYIDRLMRGLY
jgi:uncharacterized protein (TIGR02302 family)